MHRLFLFSTPFKETKSHTDRREREGREREREKAGRRISERATDRGKKGEKSQQIQVLSGQINQFIRRCCFNWRSIVVGDRSDRLGILGSAFPVDEICRVDFLRFLE